MEYKVVVSGVSYGMEEIFSVSITRPLFDEFSVGNTCSAELKLRFMPREDVPKMAQIVPYAREAAGGEWVQLGVFFTDTREKNDEIFELIAYDAMLKMEQTFLEEGDTGEWPRTESDIVSEICERTAVQLDGRTVLKNYSVEYPNDFTMREILGYIAAANGGNWIITRLGELLLVPLFASMPEETHYLVNEDGDAITFGGDRILI